MGMKSMNMTELAQLLTDAGMPRDEVPKLLGAFDEFWRNGGSIDDLAQDKAVLRRWNLQEGSMLLLKSILDTLQGVQTESVRALSVDLEDDEYDDDFEIEDDLVQENDGVFLESDGTVNLGSCRTFTPPPPPPQKYVDSVGSMPMSRSQGRHAFREEEPPPFPTPTTSRLSLEAREMLTTAVDGPLRSDARANAKALQSTTARHIVLGKWKLGSCIGQGSFGAVYTCMDDATGQLMAVKVMPIPASAIVAHSVAINKPNFGLKKVEDPSQGNGFFRTANLQSQQQPGYLNLKRGPDGDGCCSDEIKALCTEIELMRSLEHPNIVRYMGAAVDDTTMQLYIFQEWVPGGSLAELSKNYGAFAESVVRRYTIHILRGLTYLHANRIIHRDVKCGNVLVDENGVAKLADFGASHRLGKDGTLTADMKIATMRGVRSFSSFLTFSAQTPYFMAPEVLQQDKFGRRSDVWSVGGVVLQMATTDPPWKLKKFRTTMALFYHVRSLLSTVIPV